MTFGLGELFALSSAICWATAIILFKHSGETLSASALNLFKNILATFLLVPTALFVEGIQLPQLDANQWTIVAISGFIGIALSDTWYFLALRKVGAGNTAIVSSLYSPFVIVLSVLFLNETLHWTQFIGFLMVLIGIILVTWQRNRKNVDAPVLWQGLALAAGAVFLNAVGVVMVKRILEGDGFFWIISLRLIGGILGSIGLLLISQKLVKVINEIKQPRDWRILIIASVLGTYISMILWLSGYKYTDAIIASVLNETSVLFIVLFAWIFLKEEVSRRRLTGVVLAFLGVLVFVYNSGGQG
ncbi:MAG: DMT family transporter [Kangiella sp.]|nr:DMT family transporter [Kangiella sp.]